MIEDKTVFIVGAGASTNFRLPSGSELKAGIASLMEYEVDFRDVKGPFSGIFYPLQSAANTVPIDNMNDALRAAQEIAAAMPISLSIDNYLDAHRDDHVTNVVGKMAICRAIVLREHASNLTSPDDSNIYNKFQFSRSENTWLNAFFRKVTEGVPRSAVSSLFENTSIVTFNYDRCIEQFLFHALQRYYRLSAHEAASILNDLHIVHVYGQAGRLEWQMGTAPIIPFGQAERADFLGAARGISTFTEAEAETAISDAIAEAFADVERLVFLGFSFQEQNVALLPKDVPYISIYGTAKGMSKTNLEVIENKLLTHFWNGGGTAVQNVFLDDIGAEAFIDNYWRVIE